MLLITGPDPVEMIEVSEITSTTAKITWTSGQKGVDQYRVSYYQASVNTEVGYFPKDINTAILTGLLPSPTHGINTIVVTVEAISGSGDKRTTSELFDSFVTGKLLSHTLPCVHFLAGA